MWSDLQLQLSSELCDIHHIHCDIHPPTYTASLSPRISRGADFAAVRGHVPNLDKLQRHQDQCVTAIYGTSSRVSGFEAREVVYVGGSQEWWTFNPAHYYYY
jgi:hypothetical protein